MKRTIKALFLVLLLLLCLSVPALATQDTVIDNIYDNAGVLSSDERQTLSDRATALSAQYNIGVFAVVVDDFTQYGCNSIEDFSEYMYTYTGTSDCVMLVLSMSGRDFDIMAHGSGNTAFTDSGKEWLQDQFLDNFRNDDWYGGLYDYLGGVESILQGEPAEPAVLTSGEMAFGVICVVLISALVALVVCLICKAGMKSVRRSTDANAYETAEGLRLTQKSDHFTHSTRVVRQINQDSGKSGGGTTINSGGFSHSSGKF